MPSIEQSHALVSHSVPDAARPVIRTMGATEIVDDESHVVLLKNRTVKMLHSIRLE